jgi:hypothetical protein
MPARHVQIHPNRFSRFRVSQFSYSLALYKQDSE